MAGLLRISSISVLLLLSVQLALASNLPDNGGGLIDQTSSGARLLLEETDDKGTAVRQGKLLVDVNKNKDAAVKPAEENSVVGRLTAQGMVDGLTASFSMILVCEIGDETFIIAALMAMRHPRSIVLAGALSALFFMTVLSTGLGVIVPNLISKKHTNAAATVLYTFFGLRLLYIAWRADPNHATNELEEVEEKLGDKKEKAGIRRILSRFLTPIFLESFILTFLAEWGDRSQIATIALAAHKNAIGVTIGASLGHVVCTTLAVVGGRILAVRISQRTVATVGGLLFLAFAVHSHYHPPL